jgi:WD40 repeat protein
MSVFRSETDTICTATEPPGSADFRIYPRCKALHVPAATPILADLRTAASIYRRPLVSGNSVIRRNFVRQVPSWAKRHWLVKQDWDARLQILRKTRYTSTVSVALSPEGRIPAWAHNSKISLWDSATDSASVILQASCPCNVTAVAFSRVGDVPASVSQHGSVRVWDPIDGTLKRTLRQAGVGGALGRVQLAPDGRTLASSVNTTIALWDAATDTPRRSLKGHNAPVTSLSFSSDGKFLASASRDGHVFLWECTAGSRYRSFQQAHGAEHVAISPPDAAIVAACGGGAASVWNVNRASSRWTLADATDSLVYVTFSPMATCLVWSRAMATCKFGTGTLCLKACRTSGIWAVRSDPTKTRR